MKKNNSIVLIVAICLTVLSGCFYERIDLDLNSQENKKVVIIGWLNDLDDSQSIRISYSQDYFDNGREFIDDATATLSSDIETLELANIGNGEYVLPKEWKGIVGTEYTLSVEHQDEYYMAVSLLREMPILEEIRSEYYFDQLDSIGYYQVFFGFQETPGEGDGYFAIDFVKGSNQKNIIRTGAWTDDEFADGTYYADITVTQNYHQLGDTVILETHSIGKKATEYFESITSEIFKDGLLDPAPVNVTDNFSNGAVGYFITSGKRTNEIIIGE